MVAERDTSRCGTVQGPTAGAQAEKMRLLADIADALLPFVHDVVAPKVMRGLAECPDVPETAALEAFWKDVHGLKLDDDDRAVLDLVSAKRLLDPEERREVAAAVAADECRKLASLWLRKLVTQSGCGSFAVVPAVRRRALPAGGELRPAECAKFEVLQAYEANDILERVAASSDAEAIFALVNAFLVL